MRVHFYPYGRLGRFLVITLFLAVVAFGLAACGGGEDESSVKPSITVVSSATQTVRLNFHSERLVGFVVEVAPEQVTAVCWDSNMIAAENPTEMPCGKLQRGADGKLYVDIQLAYALDDGFFFARVPGQALSIVTMEAPEWQLPPKWNTFMGYRGGIYIHLDVL